MSEQEIDDCLQCCQAAVVSYEKEEMVFRETETPCKLMVLLEGTVVVGSDSSEGKRSVVAAFDRPGELFGEVFLFLNRREYDHYAQAVTPAKVLQIPKDFLSRTCGAGCGCHTKLISNMLSILAQKAYFLNQRLQLMSCATLRQKIARVLLENCLPNGRVALGMNREELADFLNAARPSLSRELMKMQADGLLRVEKKEITVVDFEKLRDI